MDEKGIKKIISVIEVVQKLRKENKLTDEGFNDRTGVAREIYFRNKNDKEFVKELNKLITEDKERLFNRIIRE